MRLYDHEPRCHWESWWQDWMFYIPFPDPPNPGVAVGYHHCSKEHGRRGELEKVLRRNLSAGVGGPVSGIDAAVFDLEKLIDRCVDDEMERHADLEH